MKTALLITTLLLFSISSIAAQIQCQETSKQVHVSAVYPTADRLPENLLRFYIYFSKPMKTDNPLSHIYLADESGNKLEGVFLENKFALWSPDRTRLTLLFDPGRVKTGLVAHNELGRALKAGVNYQLVIDSAGLNQANCGSMHRKHFAVEHANYTKPDVANWQISSPKTNSRMPLTINFSSPIDHTSLAFRLRIKDSKQNIIPGAIKLGENEEEWIFTPTENWRSDESYSLFVDPILEDIAGNRITSLFDQPSLILESAANGKEIEIDLTLIKSNLPK